MGLALGNNRGRIDAAVELRLISCTRIARIHAATTARLLRGYVANIKSTDKLLGHLPERLERDRLHA